MKNLILVAIIGLFFSCAGEDKSNANSTETSVKTAQTTNEIKKVSNPSVSETPNSTDQSNASNKSDNPAITEKPDASNSVASKGVTTESNKEKPAVIDKDAPAVDNEKPKKKKAALELQQKLEKERMAMEVGKLKEAEVRRKAELEARKAAADVKKKAENAASENSSTKTTPSKLPFNHNVFNILLQKHVSATGKVNYKGFKKDESKLDGYLANLEAQKVDGNWSKNKKLAFWINAYNAYTIKLILKNLPVKKITDLHGGKPWDVKWINLNGKSLSLNNIENDIIRPQFKEPRIHFAVNCAAKSCPPILNKSWSAATLERYFVRQAKAFINNSTYNSISKNSIEVSKIFEWYGEDFGNLIEYLNKYSNTKIDADAKVSFKEYDWRLNN